MVTLSPEAIAAIFAIGGGLASADQDTTTSQVPLFNPVLAPLAGPVAEAAYRNLSAPLSGRSVAPFAPDQIAAMGGTRNLAQDPSLNIASQLGANLIGQNYRPGGGGAYTQQLLSTASPQAVLSQRAPRVFTPLFDQQAADFYMNPYLDEVRDRTLEQFDRQAGTARAQAEARRAASRAFGTRGALAAQDLEEDIARNRAQIDANLLSQGYANAQQMFAQDAGRRMQGALANQQANMNMRNMNRNFALGLGRLGQQQGAQNLQAAGALQNLEMNRRRMALGELDALARSGALQQQNLQNQYDIGFFNTETLPAQRVQNAANILYGGGLGAQTQGPQISPIQGALAGGISGLGLGIQYQQAQQPNPFAALYRADGGRIKKQVGGTLGLDLTPLPMEEEEEELSAAGKYSQALDQAVAALRAQADKSNFGRALSAAGAQLFKPGGLGQALPGAIEAASSELAAQNANRNKLGQTAMTLGLQGKQFAAEQEQDLAIKMADLRAKMLELSNDQQTALTRNMIQRYGSDWKSNPTALATFDRLIELEATPAGSSPSKPFIEGLATSRQKRYDELTEAGTRANNLIATLQPLRLAIENTDLQGPITGEVANQVRGFLESVGVDESVLGIDLGNSTMSELLSSLSNDALLAAAGGSLGVGISNADTRILRDIVPNLSNTKDANLLKLEIMELKARRDRDIGVFVNEYMAEALASNDEKVIRSAFLNLENAINERFKGEDLFQDKKFQERIKQYLPKKVPSQRPVKDFDDANRRVLAALELGSISEKQFQQLVDALATADEKGLYTKEQVAQLDAQLKELRKLIK